MGRQTTRNRSPLFACALDLGVNFLHTSASYGNATITAWSAKQFAGHRRQKARILDLRKRNSGERRTLCWGWTGPRERWTGTTSDGYEAAAHQLGWACPIYVAETDERPRDEAGRAVETLFNDFLRQSFRHSGALSISNSPRRASTRPASATHRFPQGSPPPKRRRKPAWWTRSSKFAAELRNAATSASERLLALKFLLHFVGDLHQPLHAADDHDAGDNPRRVIAEGHPGNLHRFWDFEFVERLGADPPSCSQPDSARFRRRSGESGRAGERPVGR
jgi:S1/P1 Nuclease